MAATTNVQVIVDAKDNASAALRKIGNELKDVGGHASKSSSVLGDFSNTLKSAEKGSLMFAAGLSAVGVALGGFIGFGAQIAGDLETAKVGFMTLLGSAEQADAIINQIKKDAATTPFELPGLVQANLLLTQVTKNGGKSEEILLNVGKALSAAGKGQAELDRIIINLQQIGNVGKITEMDIRQFGFAGINILELLADYYGTTKEAAGEMVKDSKDAFGDLAAAFAKAGSAGGKFEKAFINQAGTFNQLVSNVKDSIGIFASEVVKQSGAFDAIKQAMAGFVDALNQFQPQAIQVILDFIDFIKNNGPIVAGTIIGGLIPAFYGLATALWASLAPLIPFILAGLAIGAAIQVLGPIINDVANKFGGWAEIMTTVQGTFAPLVDIVEYGVERIKQILGKLGISGEFGGLINGFQVMAERVQFYSERIVQIVSENWQKLKNFLAFGGTEGDATIVQALEGIWIRLQPLRDALAPLLDQMIAQFRLTGEIIKTQLAPAFSAFVEVMKPFVEALLPHIRDLLISIGVAIGALIAIVLGLITGIAAGLANALPYIAQALEGVIQFFRGFIQLVTGILTGEWGLALEGFKQMAKGALDFVVNGFTALLKFVSGFIKGVIAFFQGLYNTLVGNSIVPDLVNRIIALFTELANKVIGLAKGLYDGVTAVFELVKQKVIDSINAAKNWIAGQIGEWMNWGRNLGNAFVDGFWNALQALKQKAIDALNAAKSVLQGKSPPQSGPFKHIDEWGHNIGDSWVQSFAGAIGGLNSALQMPMVSAVPAIAGTEVESDLSNTRTIGGGVDEGVGGGVSFNVTIGLYAGSETEKRNIARELYSALVQVADAQNKTVKELMGA